MGCPAMHHIDSNSHIHILLTCGGFFFLNNNFKTIAYNQWRLSNGTKYFTSMFAAVIVPHKFQSSCLFLQFQLTGQVCRGSQHVSVSEVRFSFYCYELNPKI